MIVKYQSNTCADDINSNGESTMQPQRLSLPLPLNLFLAAPLEAPSTSSSGFLQQNDPNELLLSPVFNKADHSPLSPIIQNFIRALLAPPAFSKALLCESSVAFF